MLSVSLSDNSLVSSFFSCLLCLMILLHCIAIIDTFSVSSSSSDCNKMLMYIIYCVHGTF